MFVGHIITEAMATFHMMVNGGLSKNRKFYFHHEYFIQNSSVPTRLFEASRKRLSSNQVGMGGKSDGFPAKF